LKEWTDLLLPSNLGLELSLTVNVDNLEFLYEDRKTVEGVRPDTRCFREVHGNVGYRFKLLCYRFSDAIIPWGSQVGEPTLFLIYPLRILLSACITDDGELDSLTSNRRQWSDASNLLAELLCAQYSRALKIGLHPRAQPESKNGHLEQSGAKDIKVDFSSYRQVFFV